MSIELAHLGFRVILNFFKSQLSGGIHLSSLSSNSLDLLSPIDKISEIAAFLRAVGVYFQCICLTNVLKRMEL